MTEPQDSLQLGITAYKAGEKDKARAYLLRAVREQPNNEQAWGWLSNTTTTNEERIYCLRQVVRINPSNTSAEKLLKELESQEWLKAGTPSNAPATVASSESVGKSELATHTTKGIDRQTQFEARKQRRFFVSLIALFAVACIVLAAGSGGWYYFYGPCGINRVRDGGLALADQFDIYYDAYNAASTTSRAALSGPISRLRDIKRETQLIPVPACMEGAKAELVLATEATIQAFLAFESQDDIGTDFFLNEATSRMAEFRTQLEIIETCKPFCQVR